MAFPPITVTVEGQEVRIFQGAQVKHALNWVGGHQLLARVAAGLVIVWDETAGAQTDPGGALYQGQKLSLRQR